MSVAAEPDRPSSRGTPAERAWSIPPLVRGAGGELPEGFVIGERTVAHLRGTEACCEVYVVVDAEGSSCTARVARRSALRERPGLAEAMLAGAKRLAGLRHPNLLAVLGCGWTEEPSPRPYVLHERVAGRDLAAYQARHGAVEPGLLLAIGSQCAAALAALHGAGLAHADLWRGCAVLVPVGGDSLQIKLGGLEQAQVIRAGATADEEPRVAGDLAALAAMLGELADDVEDVPPALTELLARMADPERRPASAAEVKAAITEIQADTGAGASVIAAEADEILPRRLAGQSGRWGREAPAFGQMSLVMPRERPAASIRPTVTPWLAVGIVGVLAALLATMFGGRGWVEAIEVRSLAASGEEPAIELAAPRTVPDRVPPPRSPEPPVEFVAPRVERGKCEDREPAPRVVVTPRKKVASSAATPRVEEPLPVVVEEPAPLPVPPAVVPVDDGLDLLPVGPASKADGEAGPFLVSASLKGA